MAAVSRRVSTGAIADARRGYASISINWGGNRFNLGRFQGSYDGPNTDWGALDATHVPQRQKVNHFAGSLLPDDYTLDPVESPRNSNWFVVLVAARRALTFMESQPEIDAERLGVYGHSMGGKLTTNLCAIDKRVKAAVPSCGGSGDVPMEVAEQVPGAIPSTDSPLLLATISDNAYIPRITCPILWLSPTNDFHANLNHFAWTWRDVPDQLLRVSISPHLNHRHTDDHQLTQHLFFEQYLRHAFVNPTAPQLAMSLSPTSGAPLLAVTVDASLSITAVQVYYSNDPHSLTRFWRSAPTQSNGAQWTAECPISSISQPLFAYANVSYETPARYRDIAQSPGSGNSAVFTYSSRVLVLSGQQLAAARVQATDVAHERMIDDGLTWLAGLVSAELGPPAVVDRDHAQGEGSEMARAGRGHLGRGCESKQGLLIGGDVLCQRMGCVPRAQRYLLLAAPAEGIAGLADRCGSALPIYGPSMNTAVNS
jgi:dienelactone hydrolase